MMDRRRRIAAAAGLGTLVLATLLFIFFRNGSGSDALTAAGTVEATEADLAFQAGGRIDWIGVREGDAVRTGAEMARLDAAELEARRAGAQAQVLAARAQLAELESGGRAEERAQARAALSAAEQRHAEARSIADRTRRLYEGGAVSREAFDQAQTGYEVAGAQLEQAREQLRIVETGARPERIAAQRAAVTHAEALLAQVEALLANAVISAPFDGVVSVRHREPGEVVAPGAPVLTITDLSNRWVRIYVPEAQAGRLELGRRATITADGYPDREYEGAVTFIASEAEFTPRNVQTTEERLKLVYAVKVTITGDARLDLKPGLPADVRLAYDE